MAGCQCWATAPMMQLTQVDVFPSNREVLEWMVEWRGREGNARKPHAAMFSCTRSDVTKMGGSACREEGGCYSKLEQCLMYYIISSYYQAMVPFPIPDKKI